MDLVQLAIVTSLMAGQYRWEKSEDEWIEVGEILRDWRMNQRLSLAKVSRAINVSTTTLTKFERGEYTGSLRPYIEIWYRMLLTGKTSKFWDICRKNRWSNMLLSRELNPATTFVSVPRRVI